MQKKLKVKMGANFILLYFVPDYVRNQDLAEALNSLLKAREEIEKCSEILENNFSDELISQIDYEIGSLLSELYLNLGRVGLFEAILDDDDYLWKEEELDEVTNPDVWGLFNQVRDTVKRLLEERRELEDEDTMS